VQCQYGTGKQREISKAVVPQGLLASREESTMSSISAGMTEIARQQGSEDCGPDGGKDEAEMGRRQCKSKYNNMKNKTSPESSPPPTPRPEHCNVDKAEENDLKNRLMKMIEEALEGKMKDTIKEIEEKTNKKLEEINKEIEEKNKK
ncbi:hypothetical protein STEG23_023889, partial [Scotinomys teguina]